MVKQDNFIHIAGWMLSLGLKGNSLLIYAIIYGFSQTSGHYFNGSMHYLEEWTNSTRQGITKNLNELVESGLIIKQESYPTNVYYVNREAIDGIVNKVATPVNKVDSDVNEVDNGCKVSLPNNITDNKNNKDNKYLKEKEFESHVQSIIGYFNSVCNTNFKCNSKATRQLIKKHLNEGFTEDSFKKVIDSKYKEWGVNPKPFASGEMSNIYLRPTTLFGDKFETYVYEAETRESSEAHEDLFNSVSTDVDPNRSGVLF